MFEPKLALCFFPLGVPKSCSLPKSVVMYSFLFNHGTDSCSSSSLSGLSCSFNSNLSSALNPLSFYHFLKFSRINIFPNFHQEKKLKKIQKNITVSQYF